jgi:hypothetical protein
MAFNLLAPRRPTFPYQRQKSSLETNENAQAAYGDPASGFFGNMPRRTVGGAFGLPITNPDNRLDDAGIIAAGRGNPYASTNTAPLGRAPADPLGFAAAMEQQNPNGRWFGGALPAIGTSFGGAQRPMFFAPPAEQGPEMTPQQKTQFASGIGAYYNPQTGIMGGTNRVMDLTPLQFRRAAIGGGFGPGPSAETLAANAEATRQRRHSLPFDLLGDPDAMFLAAQAGNRPARRFLVGQKARQRTQERTLARQRREGTLDPLTAFFFQNPAAAMQFGLAQQSLGLQQQQLAGQNALGWGKLDLEREANRDKLTEQQREDLRNLYAALPPGDPRRAQIEGQILGIPSPPRSPMEAPKASDLALLTPAERKQILQGFSPETRGRLEQQIAESQGPGYWSRLLGLAPLDQNAPGARNPLIRYNPFTRAFLAGVTTPAPVGLSPRARQVLKNQK